MSFAIGSATVARLAACTCGTCAACAPKPVMQAVSAPVAEPASRATEDSYEPSATVPPVAGADGEEGAAVDTSGVGAERRSEETPAGERSSRSGEGKSGEENDAGRGTTGGSQQLTPDERSMVTELQARDREVRAHEAAHQAAGGGHVGGASYSYQQGPDGRQYAIGGEVPVDLSTGGGSPEAVIAKMAQVRAAAMAPADPSPQDFAVAAAAVAIAAAARQEQRAAQEQEAVKEPQPGAGVTSSPADGPVTPPQESDKLPGDRRGDRNTAEAAGKPAGDSASGGEGAVTDRPRSERSGDERRPTDGERRTAARAVDAYRAAQAGGGPTTRIDQRA